MMKWLLTGMIVLSVLFGMMNGRIGAVSNAAIQEGANAVTLFLSIVGAMCFWNGLMHIAEKSGLTDKLCLLFRPIAKLLFRGLDPQSKAFQAISMNITANLLGLGNAATPFGMEAMSQLERENKTPEVASNHMIMFVVLNTASLQLLPTTLATMRLQHGAAEPFDVMPAIWLASIVSVVAGVLMVLLFAKRRTGEPVRQKRASRPPGKDKRGILPERSGA